MDDIKLRKMDEQEEKTLPPGVRVITFGDTTVFARYDRINRRFLPVTAEEQVELCQRFRL